MKPDSPFFAPSLRVLESSPLFGGLADETLVDMMSHFRRETLSKKHSWRATEGRDRFYILISGRLKLFQINEGTGRSVTLFLLGPGDAFDVFSLLDGKPSGLYAEALDDLELLSAPVKEVRAWIQDHPEFNRAFLPYLGKSMRALADLVTDLALHDTETRLARLILRHVDEEDPHHTLRLINDLSHQQLAEMIGSVRAVVNRQLQHWKREKVIHSKRSRVVLEDLNALIEKSDEQLARRRS